MHAVRDIAGKMPDLKSKIALMGEVIDVIGGCGAMQPQEEVKNEDEETSATVLHLRLIESTKNIFSEYLLRREELHQTMVTQDAEEQ